MRFSKLTIYIVLIVVAASMAGLVYVQLRIFNADVEVYRQQFNLTINEYFTGIRESIKGDKVWVDQVNNFKGREEFVISSFEKPPELEILAELKNKVDRVFERNSLRIEYEIRGVLQSDHRCQFYMKDEELERDPFLMGVIKADHFMCLCGPDVGQGHGRHGAGKYTAFDVSFHYPNFIGENAAMLRITILLLAVIILAFSYTVITLNKQKKLSQLKNDFINNLTHEFKTPIFSISLASGLLRKSDAVKDSPRLTKYTELIDNEGKRLKSQVDKVLQMALIDSGNFKLEKKQIDLHTLIIKVAKSFELIINERDGELRLELDANQHIIHADETHLNNIIYNLLDNAQKYTDEKPEIVITTMDELDGVALLVKDNGIGMGREAQRFIFDKFYRAESGNVHNVKGFGLGLSYVKSVVEAHKGRISLKSQQNVGSEFKVFLPKSL